MEGYFLHIAGRLDSVRLGPPPGKFDYLRELKTWDLWRAVLAEGLATMLFVFMGCMAASVLPENKVFMTDRAATYIRIGLTFGLMIAILIQMIGHVSGGHINPAVSIAMALAMKISPARAVLYVISQSVGGIVGGYLLKAVTPDSLHGDLGVTAVAASLNAGEGFGVEVILTFILVFSIFGITDSNRPFFGSPALGIGFTVATMHFAGIQFTGSSMNPARSLGSAVVSSSWEDHWVYWVGPILGGVLASLLYKFVFDPYRGKMTQGEAVNQLMADGEMILIPKSYFTDGGRGGEKSGDIQLNSAKM